MTLSRAQGAGLSSRGIHDGDRESSEKSVLVGAAPHVEGRARVSTRMSCTTSDGGEDGRGFPFPHPAATDTWGRDGGSPVVWGFLEVDNEQSRPKHRGRMMHGPSGRGPRVYLVQAHRYMGLGLRKRFWKRKPSWRPYKIRWTLLLFRFVSSWPSWRQPWGPSESQGAVVAGRAPPPRIGSTPVETGVVISPYVW